MIRIDLDPARHDAATTPGRVSPERYDPYLMVHKALRVLEADTLVRLGQMDPGQPRLIAGAQVPGTDRADRRYAGPLTTATCGRAPAHLARFRSVPNAPLQQTITVRGVSGPPEEAALETNRRHTQIP